MHKIPPSYYIKQILRSETVPELIAANYAMYNAYWRHVEYYTATYAKAILKMWRGHEVS